MSTPRDPMTELNPTLTPSLRWSSENPPISTALSRARSLHELGPLPTCETPPRVSPDVPEYLQIVRESDLRHLGVWAARYWLQWGNELSNPGQCWEQPDGRPTGYSPNAHPHDCRSWDPCRKSDQALLLLESLNADLPKLVATTPRVDVPEDASPVLRDLLSRLPPVSVGWNNVYDRHGCQYPGWWVTARLNRLDPSSFLVGFGTTPQIAITRAAALAGRQRLIENRVRDLAADEADGLPPVEYLAVEVLPGRKMAKRIPHSEVCMHMQVAGKVMQVELLPGRNAAQLYRLDGVAYSSPILPSEAGIREDDGIYYCHPGLG